MKNFNPPRLDLEKATSHTHLENRISYISLDLPYNAWNSSRPSSTFHQQLLESIKSRPQTTISASVIHSSPLYKASIKPCTNPALRSPQSQSLLKSADSTSRKALYKAAKARQNPIDKYLGGTSESTLEPINSLSVKSLSLGSPKIDSSRYLPRQLENSVQEPNPTYYNRKLPDHSNGKSHYELKKNVIQFREGGKKGRVIEKFKILKKRKEKKNTEKKQNRVVIRSGECFLKGSSPLVIRSLFNVFK